MPHPNPSLKSKPDLRRHYLYPFRAVAAKLMALAHEPCLRWMHKFDRAWRVEIISLQSVLDHGDWGNLDYARHICSTNQSTSVHIQLTKVFNLCLNLMWVDQNFLYLSFMREKYLQNSLGIKF